MTPDHRPLVRIEAFTVLKERHDVPFKDGSTVGLHLVQHDGTVSQHLRCVIHDEVHAIVFDVRELMPSLKADLPPARDADRRGMVAFSARLKFDGADHFRAAVFLKRKALGLVDIEPVQQPLFVSSSGHRDFLRDDTGDRRYWAVSAA